jgi:hypothetical protein
MLAVDREWREMDAILATISDKFCLSTTTLRSQDIPKTKQHHTQKKKMENPTSGDLVWLVHHCRKGTASLSTGYQIDYTVWNFSSSSMCVCYGLSCKKDTGVYLR